MRFNLIRTEALPTIDPWSPLGWQGHQQNQYLGWSGSQTWAQNWDVKLPLSLCVYNGIEELWGHCISLTHSCRDLEERATLVVDYYLFIICQALYYLSNRKYLSDGWTVRHKSSLLWSSNPTSNSPTSIQQNDCKKVSEDRQQIYSTVIGEVACRASLPYGNNDTLSAIS